MGRTLTRLDPSGHVELGGSVFDAETSIFGTGPPRPPIAPDRVVTILGWRLDDEDRVVLLVADPTAPEPTKATEMRVPESQAAPPQTQEERIEALERQVSGLVRSLGTIRSATHALPAPRVYQAGGIGWLLLTLGQCISAFGSTAALIYPMLALAQRTPATPSPSFWDTRPWIIISAIIGFLYSAAMFVVFSRVKRLPAE